MGQVLHWPLPVTWNTGNMGSGPHEDHAGLEVLCSHGFSSLSGEWRLDRARKRLHLVGPHMYGVQYGASSARSGHGAPTICQHALTPQLQPFLAGQPPLPLPTRGLLWCCLMKGLRGSLLAHAVTPPPFHSMVSAAPPLPSPSSLLVVEQGSGSASSRSRKSSKVALNQQHLTSNT